MGSMIRNAELSIDSSELGRKHHPYRPTYAFDGEFIDDDHAYYAHCPLRNAVAIGARPHPSKGAPDDPAYDSRDIYGALRRADALKIYELAYFAEGDLIDLGTAMGLSSSIMALAMANSGRDNRIDTVDINATDQGHARTAMAGVRGGQRVRFNLVDATRFLDDVMSEGRRAAFVFVDHAHTYGAVLEACERLGDVLMPGGFALFHDYNDPRNSSPEDPDYRDFWAGVPEKRFEEFSNYGVYQGVQDGLGDAFEFYGSYGCTGLFRLKPSALS